MNGDIMRQPSQICITVGMGTAVAGSLVLAVLFGTGGSFGLILHLLLGLAVGYILAVRCTENGNELFGLVSLFYLPVPAGAPTWATGTGRTYTIPYAARPPEALNAPAGAGLVAGGAPLVGSTKAGGTSKKRPAPQPTPPAGSVPVLLSAPRKGAADDLKQIKGVGPKLEAALNELGIYHYDQIAAWGPGEIAWIDERLGAFRGQATRGDWVGQARMLASGSTR